jgi:electron transfer flavoprotein alpha subunit
MKKLKSVWIIATEAGRIAELAAGAAAWGEETALVYAGPREKAVGAETVYYLGSLSEVSYSSYIPAVVALVREKQPELVLAESSRNGRLAAAAVAAAVGASVLTDIESLEAGGDGVVARRMVYGGAARKTEKACGPTAVVCVGAGVFAPGETPAPARVVELQPEPAPGIRLLARQTQPATSVNLPAAKRIVGVGRGLGQAENLAPVRAFAAALGAEIGCSRPVAEEEGWLPKETYIGISGLMAKPELYIACGLSGQVQHMAGINRAGVIAAINKDRNAPVFRQCDYGLVADLNVVIPRLTEKLLD